MQKTLRSPLSCLVVFTALCAISGWAMPAHAQNDPSARVARLNFVQGEVTFQPGGEQDWVWAGVNRPLTSGDSLWTDQGGRAELHVGSTAIRMGEQTAVTILNVDDATIQLQLDAGTMNLHVRNLYDNDIIEVDTPNLAFTVARPGDYRITVDPNGYSTIVDVRQGEGEINGGGQAFLVDGGSEAQVSGTDSLSYDVYDLPGQDDFDQWSTARDQREDRSRSARYVSPEMTGYEDLDSNGLWRNDSTYGPVWVPTNVSRDWAPYRQGHWAWISPWGWTWVDDQQFGFVTSHYGRWAYLNDTRDGGWAWIPPRKEQDDRIRDRRPVYSPALVMFVDDSTSSSSYGSGGGVAWFPLAPGEVYVPAYRTSTTYVTRVNTTNTNIPPAVITTAVNNPTRESFANQRVVGAVTAVPKAVFVNARPVAPSAVKVSAATIATAPTAPSAPVTPVKASVSGGAGTSAGVAGTYGYGRAGAAARPPAPPAATIARPVVAKVAPPPPPVPFVQKQRALAENPGKPLDSGVEQSLRAAAPPPARVVRTVPPAPVVKAAVATPKPREAMAPMANARPGSPPVTPQSPAQSGAPPSTPSTTQQQREQQQAESARQRQLAQQEADKSRQEQFAQQQADNSRQRQLAQQQADKSRQEQLAQQQADSARQRQLAQQEAERARQAQQDQQQQARRGDPPLADRGNNAGSAANDQPVRVPEGVQAGKLVYQPRMNPPVDAKGAPIHGVVRLQALIGADGRVNNVSVIDGPPALQAAAVQNARQRRYQPTVVNGKALQVETEMSISF